ncbi:Exosome complex component Rrp4 [uncultured archaeon]|nr:Exosome complex component Rrp4 [uncultured archaeon]
MILLPGAKLDDSLKGMYGTYTDKSGTYASTISLLKQDRIVPLKGTYVPIVGDVVIGVVTDEKIFGYEVNLNSPYTGIVSNKVCREQLYLGDVVSFKIISVDEVKAASLAEPRKLYGGELIEVESVKIPRIIGKNASMLNTIREKTKSDIFVGKNGRVYLKNGNTTLAINTINFICKESHTSGLTDRVIALLNSEKPEEKIN